MIGQNDGQNNMDNYIENEDPIYSVDAQSILSKTFFWMFLGLIGTAIVAWYAYASGAYMNMIGTNKFQLLLILEVAVVLIFTFLFKKLPPFLVGALFFIYSAINGFTMSILFAIFELNSITLLFLATAALFGALSLYGYNTNKDLSNWRPLLTGTLIIGIIVSVINLFIGNTMIDIIIDWVMLFAFFGITAYDMNKVRQLSMSPYIAGNKVHIYCAMQLYLDFVNIFLRILSIFGKRRD